MKRCAAIGLLVAGMVAAPAKASVAPKMGNPCTKAQFGQSASGLSCVQIGATGYVWAKLGTPSTATTTVAVVAKKSGTYAIGETAKSSDLEITVFAVTDPWTSTNQFDTPTEGNRFVAIDLSVKNTSKKRQTFSSLIQIEVQDSQSKVFQPGIAGVGLPKVDGDVGPGETRRGSVVVEVPTAAKGLRVRVKGSITASGAVWQV